MSYTTDYLLDASRILAALDTSAIDRLLQLFMDVRAQGGRLFCLGSGGGAAHASHAVNDFRKLAGIEAYAPTDNAAELTARVNDEGWHTTFVEWLRVSQLRAGDMVLVFSVGGGDEARNISPNIVSALRYARDVGAAIGGIVGRDGGFTATIADACVIIPDVNPSNVTPHTESFQSLVAHLLVSHPQLRTGAMKWESSVTPSIGP